jgi:O-antigen/teichoic acid export membrane protein
MNVNSMEPRKAEGPRFGRQLSLIVGRVSAIELRFPVAAKGLLSIFDQAIYSGTSFLTAVLIGRVTSPEQLGLYYLVLSIILVISGVQEQIVSAPYLVYSKRRHGDDLAEYAGSNWAQHFAVTLLSVLGLLIAILGLSIAGHSELVPGLWALVVFAPLLLLRQGVRRFTFASLELRFAISVDAVVAVLQLGGLWLLSYLGWLTLFNIFAVMGIACGLACLGWYLLSKPSVHFVRARILTDWRRDWNFSKWALRTFVLGSTTPQMMLWLVSAVAGAAATGVFGACNNLIGISNVLLGGVDNVLTPQAAHAFATGGVKELRRILVLAGLFFAVTVGALCVFVLLTGDWLMVFVFGAHYHGTGLILITLTVNAAINCLSMLVHNGLWAIDQPRANFIADVCCMTVTLGAAVVLIYPFGILGAALATLAGTTAATTVRTVTLVRCLNGHESEPDIAISSAFSA